MTVQEGRPGISSPSSRVRDFGSHPAIQCSTRFPLTSSLHSSIWLTLASLESVPGCVGQDGQGWGRLKQA